MTKEALLELEELKYKIGLYIIDEMNGYNIGCDYHAWYGDTRTKFLVIHFSNDTGGFHVPYIEDNISAHDLECVKSGPKNPYVFVKLTDGSIDIIEKRRLKTVNGIACFEINI